MSKDIYQYEKNNLITTSDMTGKDILIGSFASKVIASAEICLLLYKLCKNVEHCKLIPVDGWIRVIYN